MIADLAAVWFWCSSAAFTARRAFSTAIATDAAAARRRRIWRRRAADGAFPHPGSTGRRRRDSVQVSPRAALIYRLSGDKNPLHVDPDAARRAGFDRPILHGLASYGMAAVAAASASGRAPADVTAVQCRFSGVVLPGDLIAFKIWKGEGNAMFQAFVGDRKVLDQGLASFEGEA